MTFISIRDKLTGGFTPSRHPFSSGEYQLSHQVSKCRDSTRYSPCPKDEKMSSPREEICYSDMRYDWLTGVRIMCIAVLYIPLSLPALLGGGLYTMGNLEGSHGNMVTWSLGPQPSVFIIYCRRTLKLPRDKLSQYSPGILRT